MKSPPSPSKLQLIAALAGKAARQTVARQLAAFYQADDLIIFLRDQQVGLFLPAPDFSRNLKGSKAWQRFLTRCDEHGCAEDWLEFVSVSNPVPVVGVRGQEDLIVVLIGEHCAINEGDELFQLSSLLAHAFDAERQSEALVAQTSLAREKEMSANLLAQSLDKARARLASTLNDVRQAQEALRLADKRKDEFLAILAHELRNPLAPIGNGIELLKHAEQNPQILPNVRKMMDGQLRHMVRLIDDLMDVSRITRGKISLHKQEVPLKRLIDHAIEGAKPFINQQNHRLSLHMMDDSILVHVDSTRITQVFSNLLNNAAKYSDPGGSIHIDVYADANEVTVSIRDTGMGLNEQELTSIFDMFVQSDCVAGYARGGLGIGLTLVKNLVELHEGRVRAKSAGRGQGSEFIVTLPRAQKKPELEPINDAERPLVAAHDNQLRVLIVDDNEASARSMCMIAELLGHQAQVAFRGAEALEKAERLQPQVILLDIGLPDISGYEVCHRLRAVPNFAKTLIVAQTGWGQATDRQKGAEAGFDDYLVKPLDMGDLSKVFAMANTAI